MKENLRAQQRPAKETYKKEKDSGKEE